MSDSRSPRRLIDADGQDPLARQLLRAGRVDGVATERAATLAAGVIAAVRADEAAGASASKGGGVATRGSWTKALAALAPVLGLAAVSYSIMNAPAPGAPDVSNVGPAPVTAVPTPPVASPPDPVPASPPAAPAPTPPVASPPTLAAPGNPHNEKARPAMPIARTASPSSSQASRPGEGTFEAELALLTQVTSALDEKRASRALALIDEHDRRFPNGVLAPEFAGERVLTLAALGRHAEACARATTFLAKYPKSPFVPEVRSLCVDSTSNR